MTLTLPVGLPRPHELVQTSGKRVEKKPGGLWEGGGGGGTPSYNSTRLVFVKESMLSG